MADPTLRIVKTPAGYCLECKSHRGSWYSGYVDPRFFFTLWGAKIAAKRYIKQLQRENRLPRTVVVWTNEGSEA